MKGMVGTSSPLIDIFRHSKLYTHATMDKFNKIIKYSASDSAQFRLKVIEFHNKHGTASTMDAFDISKSSIYRWKKRLKQYRGDINYLIPSSKRPTNFRKSSINFEVIAFIRELRNEHPRLGKEKIKPLVDEFTDSMDLASVSVSTIGRIIKRYCLYSSTRRVYHNPHKGRKISYLDRIKRSPKVSSFGYIEIDSITRFINGTKIYILNAIDVSLKFQFSYSYTHLSSKSSLDFFHKLEKVYPIDNTIHTIQTDNGLEFHGYFDDYLKSISLKHVYIYPRCPKINAFIERANRSLSEEFIDHHILSASISIKQFNDELIDHLIWYNTKRIHKSLGNLSPLDYLITKLPLKSHMYWTHTLI